ncbi:MAG: NAD regulator [Hyphomonadaceae bacterium]|nr:NAD regulator [Hyphomonadaceae bacterium]
MSEPAGSGRHHVVIGLSAVVVAVDEEAPFALVTREPGGVDALPFGPFDPDDDRTLELSLRRWVQEQTGFDIGYVEQLYTFGDRGRDAPLASPDAARPGARVISVGYLALTPERAPLDRADVAWRQWYRFFPYEDWRNGRPELIAAELAAPLHAWAEAAGNPAAREVRRNRVRLAFALEGAEWNEERTLDRYELLYEAGLVAEAARDRRRFARPEGADPPAAPLPTRFVGEPMQSDHRRILATAVSRLRAKIKYRPVVFELTPELFTLSRLQRIVEAVAGLELHKQNFRRLLERTELVEGLGRFEARTGGRPAELFRFRRETALERPVGGVHVPGPRQ